MMANAQSPWRIATLLLCAYLSLSLTSEDILSLPTKAAAFAQLMEETCGEDIVRYVHQSASDTGSHGLGDTVSMGAAVAQKPDYVKSCSYFKQGASMFCTGDAGAAEEVTKPAVGPLKNEINHYEQR